MRVVYLTFSFQMKHIRLINNIFVDLHPTIQADICLYCQIVYGNFLCHSLARLKVIKLIDIMIIKLKTKKKNKIKFIKLSLRK